MSTFDTFERINEADLHFDRHNPRLVEFGLRTSSSDEEIVKILWDAMDVKEITQSIIASGYWENDPLIVSQENGKNVVIEGNRRLAAVKILRHPDKYGKLISSIPKVKDDLSNQLEEIPALIQTRKESWKFLGFKHVNGPAKWGSYAKAKYVADVHNKYNIRLEDIGQQIGDAHKTVQRLYHGLMVIQQAEDGKVFDREDVIRKTFAFSHIYVGLQRDGIRNFLNIKDASEESKKPVPKTHIKKQLRELCIWLYGSKKDDIQPVVQSQNPNLKQLDQVLQNRQAIAALRNGEPLEVALELTLPVSRLFEDELLTAKRSLVKARGLLSEGYDGSYSLLRIAGTIAEIADDLYEEMERKQKPIRKKRRIKEIDSNV